MLNQILEKETIQVVDLGTTYNLPHYTVTPNGIQMTEDSTTINFVRGSKDGEVEARDGILHEELLSMMIQDLKHKNTLVPSREGSIVITKLQEALQWMRERQIDRTKRNVVGTYQK